MEAEYVYGEAPVEARLGVTCASLPELVAMAKAIWAQVQGAGVPESDEKACALLLDRLHREHRDFAASFPIVLKWMVHLRRFRAGVFAEFVRRHAAARLSSREDFIRLQAEYPVLFEKKRILRESGGARLGQFREALVAQMLEDDERFQSQAREAEAAVAEDEAAADRALRAELAALLRRFPPQK